MTTAKMERRRTTMTMICHRSWETLHSSSPLQWQEWQKSQLGSVHPVHPLHHLHHLHCQSVPHGLEHRWMTCTAKAVNAFGFAAAHEYIKVRWQDYMMERTMMMAIAGKLCAGEQSRRRRDGGEPSLGLQRTGALPSLWIIIIIMMIIIMILMMTTMMMLMTNTMMRTFALCLQRSGPIMINPKKIMTSMIIMMLDHHDDGNGFCRCWFYWQLFLAIVTIAVIIPVVFIKDKSL